MPCLTPSSRSKKQKLRSRTEPCGKANQALETTSSAHRMCSWPNTCDNVGIPPVLRNRVPPPGSCGGHPATTKLTMLSQVRRNSRAADGPKQGACPHTVHCRGWHSTADSNRFAAAPRSYSTPGPFAAWDPADRQEHVHEARGARQQVPPRRPRTTCLAGAAGRGERDHAGEKFDFRHPLPQMADWSRRALRLTLYISTKTPSHSASHPGAQCIRPESRRER